MAEKPTNKEIGDKLALYLAAIRDTCDRADDAVSFLVRSDNPDHRRLAMILRSNTDQTRATLLAIFQQLVHPDRPSDQTDST